MLTLRMFNLNINKYKCTDKIEEIISNEINLVLFVRRFFVVAYII